MATNSLKSVQHVSEGELCRKFVPPDPGTPITKEHTLRTLRNLPQTHSCKSFIELPDGSIVDEDTLKGTQEPTIKSAPTIGDDEQTRTLQLAKLALALGHLYLNEAYP